MSEAIGDIEFMVRTETRVKLIQEFYENGEVTQTELKDRLDCSRTTIQRNIDALLKHGFIENSGGIYSLTPVGEELTGEVLAVIEYAEVCQQLQPFLKWVDSEEFDIDLRQLRAADLVTPDAGDPYSLINRHVEAIEDATHGYALLPFTGLHAMKAAHQQVTERGAEFEVVAETDVVNTHRSKSQYKRLTAEMEEYEGWRAYKSAGSIPFAINVLEGVVQIIVSEGDEPRAMVESRNPQVREWAKNMYTEYKSRSTQVT